MARVIKAGGGGPKPPGGRPPTRVIVDGGGKKILGKALFAAKQEAEHILARAETERLQIIAEGKKAAARAREEAMLRGASEAFAAAAADALAAFRARADRYAEASDDIRALAMEVVRKILGNEPDLGPKDVDRILQRGMAQLRARRRLRLQVSARRLGELSFERPNLMKALTNEPDLVIEDVDDVGEGYARVVTEIGGALCAEDTALDALAMTVNVREQPRKAGSGSNSATGADTNAGTAPRGVEALRAPERTGASSTVRNDRRGRPQATVDSIPDASSFEEIDAVEGGDEDVDETMNMAPASNLRKRPTLRPDDVEEIDAVEEGEDGDISDEPTGRQPAVDRNGRPRGAQVQVGGGAAGGDRRAPTRVVPIAGSSADKRASREGGREGGRARGADESDATMRQAQLIASRESEGESDNDLDLFTDDAVGKSPRKPR